MASNTYIIDSKLMNEQKKQDVKNNKGEANKTNWANDNQKSSKNCAIAS